MFKEFRTFITRGNVIDLAVAVVIGAAFGTVVTALVADILTPIIAIPGKANFSTLSFTIHGSTFFYGAFINALISFTSIAVAVFFFVVKPINAMQNLKNRGKQDPDPTTQQCPECLSDIPIAATRCAFCTSVVAPVTASSADAAEVPPTQ
jgi:large conductance mechanosensitive channel